MASTFLIMSRAANGRTRHGGQRDHSVHSRNPVQFRMAEIRGRNLEGGVLPATVSHVRCLRGISMPYARSLPRATMSNVNKVPGNPTMNVTIFQKVVPVACARIPVKLKFAKIQTADTPPSVPVGVEVPWAAAH